MTSRITNEFTQLAEQNRMAFMPFVTAGDPNMQATCNLITELATRNVNLIEVGFPYSDPVADGPVIQASYTRALNNGLRVKDIFAGIASLPTDKFPPLVAMVSYAIIFRWGVEEFLHQAATAGFAGLIVPDLPGDEAVLFFEQAQKHHLDLIQLIAPTTPIDRAEKIMRQCSGFVYCVSVAGTTGERSELPPELQGQLKELREKTELPLAVGFGISRPQQVDMLRGYANGVIVGSAIVKQMESLGEEGTDHSKTFASIGDFASEMLNAMS